MAAMFRLLRSCTSTSSRTQHDHGYDVLSWCSPGQGLVLTEQKLPFTHEWEKPTSAVMDTFLPHHERPRRMVLIGQSMGGYLAPKGRCKGDVLLLAGTDSLCSLRASQIDARGVNVSSLGYHENLRPGVRGRGALSNGGSHSVARRSVRLAIGEIRQSALDYQPWVRSVASRQS